MKKKLAILLMLLIAVGCGDSPEVARLRQQAVEDLQKQAAEIAKLQEQVEDLQKQATEPTAEQPIEQLAHPGPGVDGPGPSVLVPDHQPVAAEFSIQAIFNEPDGMRIDLDTTGNGLYSGQPLIVPAHFDFQVGTNSNLVRMKLSNIPGHEAVELFPTIEIKPINPRTAAYLDQNSVPVQFTSEDFDQVATGNYVTKVIYLLDLEFQDLALTNVQTLVSTRLDSGDDPIVEAGRRGSIMAIIRMGNKVQAVEQPTTPAPSQ